MILSKTDLLEWSSGQALRHVSAPKWRPGLNGLNSSECAFSCSDKCPCAPPGHKPRAFPGLLHLHLHLLCYSCRLHLASSTGPWGLPGQKAWAYSRHRRRLPQQPSACHKQWVKKKPWLQQKAKLEPNAYQFARENMQYPRMLFVFVLFHNIIIGRGGCVKA